ncbi:MAG: sigma-70 family RNA polymerase sigma factor [Comamonadaceae bacterium]|nr:sigma-70 family RNA polymerase sigma factor [Comamonadaceae bacterium]RRD56923.1 sigma-70 family RNA polymerase sigma factor [Comamonadaceae bacterium OH2545_COT-014]
MAVHYYRELLNFCARNLHDRDAAADLVQETYARFLGVLRNGQAVADPRALLYRTARNLITDQHRRSQARPCESLEDLPATERPVLPRSQQPDELCAFAQYASAMLAAIEGLPPRCREAFVLHRFDGLTQQQVAERMGISRNMVAQHVIRAVLVCKACDDRFHGRTR